MFSIFTHVMKPVRDTNSEPWLPVLKQNREERLSPTFQGNQNTRATQTSLSLTEETKKKGMHAGYKLL